jgi:hypothetical protein
VKIYHYFFIILLTLPLFVIAFYYRLFFKKIIHYTNNKPNSKILFWLKFFLPADMTNSGFSPGYIFPVHHDRNLRIFGQGWLMFSVFFLLLFWFAVYFIGVGYEYKIQSSVIKKAKQENLIYFSGIATKILDSKLSLYVDKEKKYTLFLKGISTSNINDINQLIGTAKKIKVGYVLLPSFFEDDKTLLSVTINNKNILSFIVMKEKLIKHYSYPFAFGFLLLLLSIVALLLRYYIYGFKGINELIKTKEQELQKLGKFK